MRRSRHFRFRLCRLLHLCRVRFRFRWKRWFRLVEHLEQREREIEKDREREWECLLSSLWSSKKTTSRYHTEEPLINARVGVGIKCLRVTFYWRHFNRKENLETKLWPKNLKVLQVYLRIRWYFSCRIISVDVNHFIHNIRVPFVLRRPLFFNILRHRLVGKKFPVSELIDYETMSSTTRRRKKTKKGEEIMSWLHTESREKEPI